MLHVFFGHEDRLAAGTTAFLHSAISHARRPICLVPLTRLAVEFGLREGTNAFTFRRFLVPWMMGFNGRALFVDGSDMLCRADLNELVDKHHDPFAAVQVVKHDYISRHSRKYLGTGMESDNTNYPRKQWASVMLINCSHFAWRKLDPEFISRSSPLHMLQLSFIENRHIGELPQVWNWLADEHGPNPDAKLLHWTAGIPAIPAYSAAPMAEEWHAALKASREITE
jgi:hypothetical protein